MPSSRFTLNLACLAALVVAAAAQAQSSRPLGITDIMRQRAAQGAAAPALVPAPAPRPTPAAASAQEHPGDFIVALVNSEPITNNEVQVRLSRLLRQNNPELANAPRGDLARLVLERLISERAQLQVAKEEGIKVDDLAVDQAEQTVARQNNLSVAEVRQRVAADGISQRDFRNDLRNQLMLARLREREVEPKVKVSDIEVDQYLQDPRNHADATVTQTQASHILLRTDDKRTTAQAVAQLNDFKRRIEAGTSTFAGLARDNSQDGSAKNGGDLGWHGPGDFVPEFQDAVDHLQPGQISDPVVTRFGVHLIEVTGRRQAKLTTSEERDAARNQLREKRMEEAYNAWAQEVRARAYVEYRDPPQP